MSGDSVRLRLKPFEEVIYDADIFLHASRRTASMPSPPQGRGGGGAHCPCSANTNGAGLPTNLRRSSAGEKHFRDTPLGIHVHTTRMRVFQQLDRGVLGCSITSGNDQRLRERCGNANLCPSFPTDAP